MTRSGRVWLSDDEEGFPTIVDKPDQGEFESTLNVPSNGGDEIGNATLPIPDRQSSDLSHDVCDKSQEAR